MAENGRLSRNQERFLQALLLGKSIADSARFAEIAERTAYRWLSDPVFQSERQRRESALAEAEQAEIQRVLTSGYALMHRRVEALDRLAQKLERYLGDENKVWLPDAKIIGTGESAERVDLIHFNDALVREYRAIFDDLAKELGQRVKKQEIEHGGLVEVLAAEHSSLLADLEALPDDAGQDKAEDSSAAADSA
jgi:hypothetical protein